MSPVPGRGRGLRWAGAVAVAGLAVAGCGSSTSTTSGPAATGVAPSTTHAIPPATTVDPAVATAQASRVFNVLLEFASQPLATRLAVIEPGPSVTVPVSAALARLAGAGAVGASVDSTELEPASACAKAGVSAPCVKVGYTVESKTGTVAAGQIGYAVTDHGAWYVSRASACRLPPPGATAPTTRSVCGAAGGAG